MMAWYDIPSFRWSGGLNREAFSISISLEPVHKSSHFHSIPKLQDTSYQQSTFAALGKQDFSLF